MRFYISYSTKDRQLVYNLADDLAALGHTVWLDNELTGGQGWWDKILAEIRRCDVCIVTLSAHSLESRSVQLEYQYAEALDKLILPVLLSDGVIINLLPPSLEALQYVDYRRQDKSSTLKLARAVSGLPAPKPLPDPLPASPPAPISPLGPLASKIATSGPLSLEEQVSITYQLRRLFDEPEHKEEARILLTRLSNRADVFATIYNEIQNLLNPKREIEPVSPVPRPGSESPSILKTIRDWLAPQKGESAQSPVEPRPQKPSTADLSTLEIADDLQNLIVRLQQRPDLVPVMTQTLQKLMDEEGKRPPSDEKQGYIFLSYSSKDREFVFKLAKDLKDNGHQIWLDVWRITGRKPYWNEIQEGVEHCSHFLFVISPDALTEESGALTELYHVVGLKPKRVIVPVVAKAYPFEKLPMVISPGRYQIHDFTKFPYQELFPRVLTALT